MVSGATDTPRSGLPPAAGELTWHTLGADQVLRAEGVDGQRGLSSAEVAERTQRFGPNEFAAGRAEPRWHAFLRQYRDPMQLVLLAAGIGSLSKQRGGGSEVAHDGIYGWSLAQPLYCRGTCWAGR